ncbi:hypothetical protein JYU34_005974 [Plutella xylostella]|uniref:Uncharacterized protein n=1 Tax=Plutella xylostella TaxID=51655 RepID=A0ABQ7QUN4_PLUXY|nr:hypothetical protein JYU34_005974 [Plutella xylostella]
MLLLILLILYFDFYGVSSVTPDVKTALDKYGPFKVKVTEVSLCKGPKLQNGTENTLSFDTDMENITYQINMKTKTKVDKVKITVWKSKLDSPLQKRPDVYYRINNPCQHFFVAPVLRNYYRVKDEKKCEIEKGMHIFSMNIQSLVYQFAGVKFFYGKYGVQYLMTGPHTNLICTHAVMDIYGA